MSNEQQNNQNDNAKTGSNLFFPKNKLKNLTILIDADNVTSFVVEELFYIGRRIGQDSIRRAYADWRKEEYLLGWDRACLFNGIDAIQQFAYRKGKNSSDIRLVIDAMELSFSEKVDGFLIASSDSDFTPLVMNLRKRGFPVYGFGRSITHHAFKGACNYFYAYDELPSFQEKINRPHYHPKGEEIRLIELKEWKEIEERQEQWKKAQQEGNKNDVDLTEELEKADIDEEDNSNSLGNSPTLLADQAMSSPENKNDIEEDLFPEENKSEKKKNIPTKKTNTFKKTYSWLQWLQEFLPEDLPKSLKSGPIPPEYQNLTLNKKEKEELEKLRPLAYELIRKNSDNQGWTPERAIKPEIESSIENFSPANYGCKYFSVVIFALDNICVGYREQRRVEQWQENKSFPQSWARYYRIIDRERLIGFINNAIEKCKDETGWAKVDALPNYYTFKPLNFGFKNQWDLLAWLGYEIKTDRENGDKTCVLEIQDQKVEEQESQTLPTETKLLISSDEVSANEEKSIEINEAATQSPEKEDLSATEQAKQENQPLSAEQPPLLIALDAALVNEEEPTEEDDSSMPLLESEIFSAVFEVIAAAEQSEKQKKQISSVDEPPLTTTSEIITTEQEEEKSQPSLEEEPSLQSKEPITITSDAVSIDEEHSIDTLPAPEPEIFSDAPEVIATEQPEEKESQSSFEEQPSLQSKEPVVSDAVSIDKEHSIDALPAPEPEIFSDVPEAIAGEKPEEKESQSSLEEQPSLQSKEPVVSDVVSIDKEHLIDALPAPEPEIFSDVSEVMVGEQPEEKESQSSLEEQPSLQSKELVISDTVSIDEEHSIDTLPAPEPEIFSDVPEVIATEQPEETESQSSFEEQTSLQSKEPITSEVSINEKAEEEDKFPLSTWVLEPESEASTFIEKLELQVSPLPPENQELMNNEEDYSDGILMTFEDDDLGFLVNDFNNEEVPDQLRLSFDDQKMNENAAAILKRLAQQEHFCGEDFVAASHKLSALALKADHLQDKLSVEDASFAADLLAISEELRSIGENMLETPSEHNTPAAAMIYRITLEKWAKEITEAEYKMMSEQNAFAQSLATENLSNDQEDIDEKADEFLEIPPNEKEEKHIYSWREFYPDEDLDTIGPIFPTYYESYCNKEFDVEKLEFLKLVIYDAIYFNNLGNDWASMSSIEKYLKSRLPDFNPEDYDCLNMYYLLSMVNNLCPGYERDQETEDMIPTEQEIYFRIVHRGMLMSEINHFIRNYDKNAWTLTSIIEKNVDIEPLKIGFKDFDELLIWLGYEIKKDIQGSNRTRIKEIEQTDFFPDFAEYPMPNYLQEQEEKPVTNLPEKLEINFSCSEIPKENEEDLASTDIEEDFSPLEEAQNKDALPIQVVEKTIADDLEVMPMSHFYPPNSFVHQKFYLNAVKDYLPVPNYRHDNLPEFLTIKPLIYRIIRAISNDKGWALLKDIEHSLQKNIPNFSPDYYGFPNTMSMLKIVGDICLGYDKNQFRDLRAEYGYTPFNKLKHYYMIIPYHDLLNSITEGIHQYQNKDGWVNIGQLEEYVRPLFDFQYYGFYYFSDLLSSILTLEIQNNFVRLKEYTDDE